MVLLVVVTFTVVWVRVKAGLETGKGFEVLTSPSFVPSSPSNELDSLKVNTTNVHLKLHFQLGSLSPYYLPSFKPHDIHSKGRGGEIPSPSN